MAKGSIAKNEVYSKIMEIFPGSFMYNDGKELRINTKEDGEPIQIKLVLTAAKTPVSNGEDNVLPGAEVPFNDSSVETKITEPEPARISEEEKQSIQDLMSKLGL